MIIKTTSNDISLSSGLAPSFGDRTFGNTSLARKWEIELVTHQVIYSINAFHIGKFKCVELTYRREVCERNKEYSSHIVIVTWSRVFSNCCRRASLAAACFCCGVSSTLGGGGAGLGFCCSGSFVVGTAARLPFPIKLTRLAGRPGGKFFGSCKTSKLYMRITPDIVIKTLIWCHAGNFSIFSRGTSVASFLPSFKCKASHQYDWKISYT